MSDTWYYVSDGKSTGPVSLHELKTELQKRGNWRKELVWQSGINNWIEAGTITEVAATPPPLPINPVGSERLSPVAAKLLNQPKRGRRVGKILLLMIGIPFILFVLLVLSDLMSSTQYYATSVGFSIRECRNFSTTLGMAYSEVDQLCSKRIPK